MTLAITSTCVGGRRAGYRPGVVQPRGFELWKFTPREIDTIEAVISHGSSKKAAAALGLSPKTVEAHIGKAYLKVGVRHISQLVAAYVTEKFRTGGFE